MPDHVLKIPTVPSDAELAASSYLKPAVIDNSKLTENAQLVSAEPNRNFNQGMEFLIPQAPAVREGQPISRAKSAGIFHAGIDMKENFHQLQTQHKMTKKQIKLAQVQLDKLNQINIHLRGMFIFVFVFFLIFIFFSFFFNF